MADPLTTAMVLAAGFGKRMRPLTDRIPKPLVPLLGKPLIDWTLARLRDGAVTNFVVNSHYKGDQIAAHFTDAKNITLSPETEILETGGGVKKALPLLGTGPFFVANADIVWLDGTQPAIARMRDVFDPNRMDALLLVHPTVATGGDYDGVGDYHLDNTGVLSRRSGSDEAPFVFTGVSILKPDLFSDTPEGAFSLNVIFDRAQEAGRLYGLVHDGEWYHVGTPAALSLTEQAIEQGYTASNTR